MTETVPMPPDVRVAVPSDEEPLMALLREMHVENGLAPLDEEKVRFILQRGLRRDRALVGVIRGPERIEASVGLFVGEWWYSSGQHVEDFWCFTAAEFRRSTHSKHLLDFARWAAVELGYPLLMGVLSTERTEAKVKLYERRLGKPVGALFVCNSALREAASAAA